MYFFLQFFLSILSVFNWEHRTHSCLLPFIHQLHSPVPVCSQQELIWAAGLLHEASHFTPTLIPGGSSQGWLSTLDTPGGSSVQVAPGFQGTHNLAGNLVRCCSTRYFPCQQSSYFGLSQISHECPAWAVCVKWHLHGFTELSRIGDAAEIWKRKIHPRELILGSQRWCFTKYFFGKFFMTILLR